jgi:hypothetical protein
MIFIPNPPIKNNLIFENFYLTFSKKFAIIFIENEEKNK